ncbi:uncharacterized protein [Antedon mediterranea]|uniref:uncharacterized protein n=1 Tax=Antedon mediterranea TaxID=105859 RepID=UPI003AF88708
MGKRGPYSGLRSSEKKRRKLTRNVASNARRILLNFDTFQRWSVVKEANNLASNSDVANFLLDSHAERHSTASGPTRTTVSTHLSTTSTPIEGAYLRTTLSGGSDTRISSISGIDRFSSNSSTVTAFPSASEDGSISNIKEEDRPRCSAEILNMTIDINLSSESESESTCDEDEDYDLYEPSFDISLCPNNALNLRETSFVEEEFEIEAENDDPSSQIEEDIEGVEVESPYVKHIDIMEESDFLIKDETCIVYLNCLKTLAEIKINKSCTRKSCSSPVDLHSKFVGSAVYFKWICTNGHLNNKWCSQPILKNKLHGGDLLMSTALLASGNNYAKIALLAKFLKLHILNVNTYYRIQRKYLVPAVTELWEDTQKEILTAHEGKDVVLLGDGRMDSPGHSAQFCTYTMMDNADKSILSIMTIDKRETEGKSRISEECFISQTTKCECR